MSTVNLNYEVTNLPKEDYIRATGCFICKAGNYEEYREGVKDRRSTKRKALIGRIIDVELLTFIDFKGDLLGDFNFFTEFGSTIIEVDDSLFPQYDLENMTDEEFYQLRQADQILDKHCLERSCDLCTLVKCGGLEILVFQAGCSYARHTAFDFKKSTITLSM